MSTIIKTCQICQQIIRSDKYQQHMNLHAQPHELVPKTRPNNLKKIEAAKILHVNDSTDQSDIAVRSILPNEVPQPDVGKRDVTAPELQWQFSRLGKGKDGKVGSYNVLESGEDIYNNSSSINKGRLPENDRLDLNSNVVRVQVQKFQDQTLDIEKVIDLKPKKTLVTKKQVHKYQNTHNLARQSVDLGGCDKKVMANPLAQSRNVMVVPAESVYQIKEVEKPFLASLGSSGPKNKATVGFSRKTAQSNPYNPIDTKSVQNTNKKNRQARPYNEQEKPYNDYDSERHRANQKNRDYQSEKESDKSNQAKRPKDRGGDRPYPLHHHQCPDCHGFYCPTCKSTIPPTFRPFWDQNQRPEAIQYYKSLQQQVQKNKRHGKECPECNPKE